MPETISLKVTSAVAVSGEIKRAGSIIHVDEATAKTLLQIGKAEPASDADVPQTQPEPEAPKASKKAPADETPAAPDAAAK